MVTSGWRREAACAAGTTANTAEAPMPPLPSPACLGPQPVYPLPHLILTTAPCIRHNSTHFTNEETEVGRLKWFTWFSQFANKVQLRVGLAPSSTPWLCFPLAFLLFSLSLSSLLYLPCNLDYRPSYGSNSATVSNTLSSQRTGICHRELRHVGNKKHKSLGLWRVKNSRWESHTLSGMKGKECLFQPTLSPGKSLSGLVWSRGERQFCHYLWPLVLLVCLSGSLGLPPRDYDSAERGRTRAGLPLHRSNTWQIHYQNLTALTFQSQYWHPDLSDHSATNLYQDGFPLRPTNIHSGNGLDTQRRKSPPKVAGCKDTQRGFFCGLWPVHPSVTFCISFIPPFSPYSFIPNFFFSFPALGTLSYYLIPLSNFWEKVIADPSIPRRARRLQRHYVFITIIFILNWYLQAWNLESISQS